MDKLYTIGFTKKNAETFFGLLTEHMVKKAALIGKHMNWNIESL
jgi:hypothetical protein